MRDSQRLKVYNAEWQVGHGKEFDTQQEIQQWVDKIVSSKWWKSRFPERKEMQVTVVLDKRRRRACARRRFDWSCERYTSSINLPHLTWAMCQLIVLHEISHLVTEIGNGHDRKFCRNYLSLVDRWMGKESAKELREAFRHTGVKWHARKKLSQEQRDALSQRAKLNFNLS